MSRRPHRSHPALRQEGLQLVFAGDHSAVSDRDHVPSPSHGSASLDVPRTLCRAGRDGMGATVGSDSICARLPRSAGTYEPARCA
ncbi:Hypothetical protein A7982_10365 [Minicystis rosea]|nr:Hypothetical protein A7982_10365 [Minicystis rosea]